MRVTYDGTVDAAYIYLQEKPKPGEGTGYTVDVDLGGPDERPRFGSITLDFDANDRLVGIEVLAASHILPWEVLVTPPGH